LYSIIREATNAMESIYLIEITRIIILKRS